MSLSAKRNLEAGSQQDRIWREKGGSRVNQGQCLPNSKESNARSSQKLGTLFPGQRKEAAPLRTKDLQMLQGGIAMMGWEMIEAWVRSWTEAGSERPEGWQGSRKSCRQTQRRENHKENSKAVFIPEGSQIPKTPKCSKGQSSPISLERQREEGSAETSWGGSLSYKLGAQSFFPMCPARCAVAGLGSDTCRYSGLEAPITPPTAGVTDKSKELLLRKRKAPAFLQQSWWELLSELGWETRGWIWSRETWISQVPAICQAIRCGIPHPLHLMAHILPRAGFDFTDKLDF